jgi:glutamate-1-semialdehyde 2,1-aminomutase
MGEIDRGRLKELMEREVRGFEETHPRSRELFERAKRSMLAGVPMPWMTEWAGPWPVFTAEAHGARFTDVDGNEYVDFCLGDTGAMTGHSPGPTAEAVARQAARGITLMLPTEDAIWVGEEMARRFGLPYWQFCLTGMVRRFDPSRGQPRLSYVPGRRLRGRDRWDLVPAPDREGLRPRSSNTRLT